MYDLYAIFKQTHPPSAVEHCAVCKFFSSSENNLVIAGTSLIRVYRLVDDKNADDDHGAQEFKEKDPSMKKKLELVGQYSLFGSVKSLKAVRLVGNVRDSLLFSFDEAKLAIVEYDPGTHDLKTISLHYFEEEELKGGMRLHFNDPTIRVDPDNRCSAMWIYSHWLVVLPFRQEGALDEHDSTVSGSKPQVLASYTINMRNIDQRLSNIIDIQFLHGYYEPTLLILYEPLKTWPGRLAVRQDTCALVAISLNLTEKVHPVIWSVEHLPFDCSQVLPIPKPIGGILLFATNSLIYLNQSVPAYGVSLNTIAKGTTMFPLREQEDVAVTLDSAHGTFISNDRLVISLKGGEIYVLTLVTDGIKSVRSFNFDKAAASVQTSCICSCEGGYLFLGSRLGNSLLLKYTEKVHELFPNGVNPTIPKEGLPPHMKRRKLDSEYIYGLDDLDELEVYGADTKGTELASYSFEIAVSASFYARDVMLPEVSNMLQRQVCDSLFNIGPCSCVDMGEPAFLSEEFAETSFPDMELVTCSGYGKNGAISVLQKSVRPQVVTTFELPGCVDMWTVTTREPQGDTSSNNQKEKGGPMYHSFLILSRKDSSMVLRTEQEIMELDHSGFSTQYPTVCAANLGDGRYILQVTPMGVRLLDGVTQIQHIPMDAGFSSIVWCSVADPYAVMMTADGTLMLLKFTSDSNSAPNLTVSRVHIDQWSVVCACCCYKDVSGMFTTEKLVEQYSEPTVKPASEETKRPQPSTLTTDDEDELLYGDSDCFDVFSDTSSRPTPSTTKPSAPDKTEIKPSYWCVLCRENGALEIYSVPDFKLAFCVRNFAVAPKVLVDSGAAGSGGSSQNQDENLVVKEVLLTGLHNGNNKPLLAALVDQDLLLYEAFSFSDSSGGHLSIRFKKIQHNVLVREKKSKIKARSSSVDQGIDDITEPIVGRLRAFNDISTYSGIFVCGSYPYWLFLSSRNALRTHPMNIDGAVSSFAPFHNVNCPKGFLYFNKKGELRVSVLPTHLSYDAPWPVRKIPLRCTPHFVAYNRESKTHAVVSSQIDPVKVITRLGLEDREFVETEDDPRYVYPFLDKFSVQLISPISWEIIPNTKFELDDYERVTTMKNITLNSEETVSRKKGFIVVGTTYVYGEDLPCKGRILIFDIIEVVPEPGQPLTKNKFKVLYRKEQKGPVTAISEVTGYLLSAIGQKIYIWDFKSSNDLIGVAFIDTQLYIHSAISVKNLIFIADIAKSVTLLRFQEETKTLAFVSRDQSPLVVYGTEFFVDGSQLGFLVSDNDMNLVVYRYQPEASYLTMKTHTSRHKSKLTSPHNLTADTKNLQNFGSTKPAYTAPPVRRSHLGLTFVHVNPASVGGQKLLHTADINISSSVTSFFRCRVKTEKSGNEKAKDLRQASWFGTLDGGLGFILPMPEKTFRRLHMVQNMLMHSIPHYAGLNPKAFRLLRWKHRPLDNPQHHVLDFELLSKFVHLGVVERLEVTRKIGVAPAQVLDDLMEVDRVTSQF